MVDAVGYLAKYLNEMIGTESAETIAALRAKLAMLYGTTLVANTTLAAVDMGTIVPVQTGSSTIVITLLAAGTAGQGGLQWVEKIDDSAGIVRVVDETGAWMADLLYPGDTQAFAVDSDGTGWHPVVPINRIMRYGGSRFWRAFSEMGAGGNPLATGLGADTLMVHPIDLREPRTIDAFGISIMANTPSTWQAKTALYAWGPASPFSPAGAALIQTGSTVGNAGGVTAQSSLASTFTATRLPRHGRAWAVSKTSIASAATNTIVVASGAHAILGGVDARELAGFTADDIKGFIYTGQSFASAFPANLPGSPTTVSKGSSSNILALFPRIV